MFARAASLSGLVAEITITVLSFNWATTRISGLPSTMTLVRTSLRDSSASSAISPSSLTEIGRLASR